MYSNENTLYLLTLEAKIEPFNVRSAIRYRSFELPRYLKYLMQNIF